MTGGRGRPGGKQEGVVLCRVMCFPGWSLAVGQRDKVVGQQREGESMEKTGQVRQFLSQLCTREV